MSKPQRTIRNFVARSPLLGKGGMHVESKTSARMQSRSTTRRLIDDWPYNEDENRHNTNAPKSGR